MAAVGVGFWKNFDVILDFHQQKGKIEPNKKNNKKYEKILKLFENIADIQSDIGEMIENTKW